MLQHERFEANMGYDAHGMSASIPIQLLRLMTGRQKTESAQ